METTPEPKGIYKKLFIIVFAIGIMTILGFGIWWLHMFGTAELAARCDNGYTVWRRNPGAWSSYIFEIRDGTTIIESNLRSRHLNDALNETHCIFLGGG